MDAFKINFLINFILMNFGNSWQQVFNAAVNKPASQHTDVFWNGFDWVAEKAVDNCLLRDLPDLQECCSASQPSRKNAPFNYWRLNMTRPHEVVEIEIYAREDERLSRGLDNQLAGFELYTIEVPGGDEELGFNDTHYHPADNIYTWILPSPQNISEIVIRRPGHGIITLCEVQVFAVCDDGNFGEGCLQECGHCLDGAACNKTSGECPSGCEPDFYGSTCICGHCLNGEACDETSETCPNGCAAGWREDSCSKSCENGTYGENCNNTCGHCLADETCDIFSGSCPSGCEPGWQGDTCSQACSGGSYGQNCGMTCGNCHEAGPCNNVNGTCEIGCDPGWTGGLCLTVCASGTYGLDCRKKCGYCRDGSVCNHTSGACANGCAAGYHGTTCQEECECGRYGENCEEECGYCTHNTFCNKKNGTCPAGCMDGYRGPLCMDSNFTAGMEGSGKGFGGKNNVGAIVGGVFGGLAFLCLVGIGCYVFFKWRRKATTANDKIPITELPGGRSGGGNDYTNKSFDGQVE